MAVENKDICRECGGFCCKKSGCDYAASDFNDLGTNALIDILNEGNVSIIAAPKINYLSNGRKTITFVLYLRARNVGRGPVDLFSFKKQCSMLTDNGCSYDLNNRPTGGANLIPMGLSKSTGLPQCHPEVDPLDILMSWEPYQNTLRKAVKRITGMTVEKCFERDVEQVLFEILTEQFEGIQRIEIIDMLSGINDMALLYPEAYKRAKVRADKYLPVVQTKRLYK